MKNSYFVVLVALCFSISANAQSYAGGGISITNNGDNTFQIDVDYIKNCRSCRNSNPCNLPDSAILNFVSGRLAVALSLVSTFSTPIERCFSAPCTKCTNDSCAIDYGYTNYKLSANINLDQTIKSGVCAYTIAVEMGVLDTTLSTIIVENKPIIMTAKFDACSLNSTPKLDFIDGIICLGRDFDKGFKITDLDKDDKGQALDKYIFSLVEPLAKNGSLTYKSGGYSATKPLYYLGFPKDDLRFPRGFKLDSATGQFLFRNMKMENSFLRVKIEEFRNNILISTTFRDMHFDVAKCLENNNPVISGINCSSPQTENFNTAALVGETICFNICTADKDKQDTVTLDWNKSIPGASFEILDSDARRQTARFCWTPTDNDISKFPYAFIVNAFDNGCPTKSTTARSFFIQVKDKPRFEIMSKIDDCGKGMIVVKSTGEVKVYQWLFTFSGKLQVRKGSNSDTFYLSSLTQGYHNYSITAIGTNGANNILTDSILSHGNPPFRTDLVRYDICPKDTAFFSPIKFSQPGSTLNWLSSNSNVIDTFFHPTSDENIYLIATLGKCTDTLKIEVNVLEFKEKLVSLNKSGDVPHKVKFSIEDINDANKIIVDFGDGIKTTYYLRNDTMTIFHTYTNKGVYNVGYSLYRNNMNCGNPSVLYNNYINIFPTSISEIEISEISLFPNPNNGNFFINSTEIIELVNIYNIQGQLLKSENTTNGHLQLSQPKPGLYRAEIILSNGASIQKLFIIK